jgi:alpha-ketoglutarate-dependent taurine dioxygenase
MFCTITVDQNTETTGLKIKECVNDPDIKVIHVVGGPCDEKFWEDCAKKVGDLAPMEENAEGNKTGRIFTDIKHPWHQSSESFSYSNTRQPLHTDGSYESNAPDMTFFCCLESPRFGGHTTFVEVDDLVQYIGEYSVELLERIRTEIVKHGKGNDSKTKPILQDEKLTWNYYRCQPCKLRDDFHEFLEKYIVGGNLFQSVRLNPGEALFFKDEELLHGRTAFLGHRWLVKGGIYVR